MARFFRGLGWFLAGVFVVAMPIAFLGLWIELRLSGSHRSVFQDPGVSIGMGGGFWIGLIVDAYLAVRLSRINFEESEPKGSRDDLE